MLRGKSDQFLIYGFETNEVALGLDSKMAEVWPVEQRRQSVYISSVKTIGKGVWAIQI